MSRISQVLIKCEKLAQLLAGGDLFTRWGLVRDFLTLPKGLGAISAAGDSFAHFEVLATRISNATS